MGGLKADETDDITMTPTAFEFAVSGLKISKATKEAARLVLVEELTRTEVRQQTGISSDTLSKSLGRIAANLEARLKAEKLVFCHHITTPEFADGVASTEALILESRIKKKARKAKC